MTRSFTSGVLLCMPLPWIVYRLRLAGLHLDDLLAPIVATGRDEGFRPVAATLPEQRPIAPVRLIVEDRPSDPKPVVTPERAKAGGIRRAVQPPPCHACPCCTVYATRQHDAHLEIDRLREELVAADSRRINQRRIDPLPFGSRP